MPLRMCMGPGGSRRPGARGRCGTATREGTYTTRARMASRGCPTYPDRDAGRSLGLPSRRAEVLVWYLETTLPAPPPRDVGKQHLLRPHRAAESALRKLQLTYLHKAVRDEGHFLLTLAASPTGPDGPQNIFKRDAKKDRSHGSAGIVLSDSSCDYLCGAGFFSLDNMTQIFHLPSAEYGFSASTTFILCAVIV